MQSRLKGWLPYFAVLAILLLLLLYSQLKQKSYEVSIEPVFPVDGKELASFRVSKDSAYVMLSRTENDWMFVHPDTGKPAGYRMDDFLRHVIGGQREGYITDDTSSYTVHGMDDSQVTTLEISTIHGKTIKAYLGRNPAEYSSEYIRYEGNDRIYPLRQRTLNYLGTSSAWWR